MKRDSYKCVVEYRDGTVIEQERKSGKGLEVVARWWNRKYNLDEDESIVRTFVERISGGASNAL